MQITFLGHHSWHIESNSDNLLIDPVLGKSFGNSSSIQFTIYPFRDIDIHTMPKIKGIVLTNEHAGHFDIKSILKIFPRPTIYLFHLIPYPVVEILERHGFSLVLCLPFKEYFCGDFKIYFCPGSKEVPLWETRTCNVIVSTLTDNLFVQSDTLISADTVRLIKESQLPIPSRWLVPNNLQYFPQNTKGPFDNNLNIDDWRSSKTVGIRHFYSLLTQSVAGFSMHENVDHIYLSGSGYLIPNEAHEPFLWSVGTDMDEIFDFLRGNTYVYLLRPGQYNLSDNNNYIANVSWVTLKDKDILPTRKHKQLHPVGIYRKQDISESFEYVLTEITNEMNVLAPYFLCSEVCKDAMSINRYTDEVLSSKRAVIIFHHSDIPPYQTAFTFDLNTSKFDRADISIQNAINKYPYGLEIGLYDFFNVIRGKAQIWDICMATGKQWFFGNYERSIIAFLFAYYSEQIQVDLFRSILENAIEHSTPSEND